MLTIHMLSLKEAQQIAELAQAAAPGIAAGFPVSIVVVDATTIVKAMIRMDGAPLMSAEGAYEKARSSAQGGNPTSFFEKPLNEGRYSVLRLPVTPVEGGIPVLWQGQCVGAVGVAGAPPHLDARIAQQAVDQFVSSMSAQR